MGSSYALVPALDLIFPSVIAVLLFTPSLLWGSVAPFYLGYSPIEFWDSLSGYVHPGIACLAFQAFDWLGAFWASLSDYPLSLGVYTSVTFC